LCTHAYRDHHRQLRRAAARGLVIPGSHLIRRHNRAADSPAQLHDDRIGIGVHNFAEAWHRQASRTHARAARLIVGSAAQLDLKVFRIAAHSPGPP